MRLDRNLEIRLAAALFFTLTLFASSATVAQITRVGAWTTVWFGPKKTDPTSTTWITAPCTLSSTAALSGDGFSVTYLMNFDADPDRLQMGCVRLRIKRTG